MVVTIKKPSSSKLKKRKKAQKISIANQDLILILLLFPLSIRVSGSFPLWLPPTTKQLWGSRSYTTPSLRICIISQQAPAGVEEWICEGVNTRSPIIAQRRQKIAAKSVNCFFFFFFCLEKKKITLGFKDSLLKDDSMVVNIHVLHMRISVYPCPPRIPTVYVTVAWIWRVNHQTQGQKAGNSAGSKEGLAVHSPGSLKVLLLLLTLKGRCVMGRWRTNPL